MVTQDWQESAIKELELAHTARISGNEGRARVCARRAAGHVIGEYLSRSEITFASESALERLRYLYSSPQITEQQRETVGHFLVHTTPDHILPIDADLIEDVHLLARQLMGESFP